MLTMSLGDAILGAIIFIVVVGLIFVVGYILAKIFEGLLGG